MNGRLEQEQKQFTTTEKKLKDDPDYVIAWYTSLRASDCSSRTCDDYTNKIRLYLSSINPDINKVTVGDLNYLTASRFCISTKTKVDDLGNLQATSDSYQLAVWSCLNNFFKFLKGRHLVDENPMELIKKPKNKDLERINENRLRLDKYDFQKILEAVNNGAGSNSARIRQEKMRDRDQSIMMIFMTTGIRRSALMNINIEDIDFYEGTVSVIDKGDKWRKCRLTDDTLLHLHNWVEQREDFVEDVNTNALFVSAKGTRLNTKSISKIVDKYCEEALGYHVSPHKLRSGFCSIMYTETGDIEKVRRMVGHSNVATTQRYIVTGGSERDEVARIMSGILG